MFRIAIVTSHPIQYNAPWFKLLNERGKIIPKVFYTWGDKGKDAKYDPGFGKKISWDIPLLQGYDSVFVKNTSADPGTHHFWGIRNPTLIKDIESWKPDFILIFGWNYFSHLKCMIYFHNKISILFRGDSTLLGQASFLKKTVREVFLKWVYSYVDYALFVGSENKKYFQKFGFKENQLKFVPHAIDNNRFQNPSAELDASALEWRGRLGIEDDTMSILYAGKFESIKNTQILIDLAEKYKYLPIKFILVGNGPLENELKESALGNPNIIFLDFQNQSTMPVVYRLGDVFILPSKSETWGLAINEAMACDKPILVSNTCGCAIDLVKNGHNGYIFNNMDLEDLFEKTKLLISNKKSLNEFGMNSGLEIQKWSFEKICEQIESIIS